MTDDRIRELLHEMRDEPVPSASVQRVHAEVSQRIAAPSRRGISWRMGSVLALAASILIAALVLRQPSSPPAPKTAAVTPAIPPPQAVLVPAAVAPKPAAPRRIRKPAAQPDSGALIRIETPDPDVVILLIGED